jgi:hypothetical protein
VSGLNRLVVALLALGLLLFALLMVGDLLAALHDADEYTHGRSLTRYLLEDSFLLLVGLAGAVGGGLYALGGERFAKGAWLTYGATGLLILWLLLYYSRS